MLSQARHKRDTAGGGKEIERQGERGGGGGGIKIESNYYSQQASECPALKRYYYAQSFSPAEFLPRRKM